MTQQAIQAQHPQRIKPESKALDLMTRVMEDAMGLSVSSLSFEDAQWLAKYMDGLRRKALKVTNQRRSLRELQQAHLKTLMEARFYRVMIGTGPNAEANTQRIRDAAEDTLFAQFRELEYERGEKVIPKSKTM